MGPETPTDDHDEDRTPDDDSIGNGDRSDGSDSGARERLEQGADRAVSEFDEGLVDLLAWVLDTETRARIYIYLRQHPGSTSDEVADGTGLYPSTVREALAELTEEETLTRRKREHDGTGNNPYEYTAIAPSDLVRNVAERVQSELNTVSALDRRLGGDADGERSHDEAGPVTITIDEERTAADVPGGSDRNDAEDHAADGSGDR